MFSKFIRLGAALSAAVLLASCSSGSGQAETQQSTPEGLFEGTTTYTFSNSNGTSATTNQVPATCTQHSLAFVDYAGVYYMFNTMQNQANQSVLVSASSGSLSYSNGTVGSTNVIEVVPPNAINQGKAVLQWNGYQVEAPNGTNCNIPITYANEQVGVYAPGQVPGTATPQMVSQNNNSTVSPTFTGAYNTGINLAGYFTYPTAIDTYADFKTGTFNLNYNADYQGVQNLGTLAGTYVGTVSTSQFSEPATFTFGPASVPANSGNAFGVGLVTGTGASGCTYSGTVSPLFKGNGYTMVLNSGTSPCVLPGSQFAGLVYLNVAQNQLYSFSVLGTRTDGVVFVGTRH